MKIRISLLKSAERRAQNKLKACSLREAVRADKAMKRPVTTERS